MQVSSLETKQTIRDSRLLANVIGLPKRFEKCGYKNFIVKDDNKNAVDGCKNLDLGQCLTLTGNVGTGKSHLAVATLRTFPAVRLDNKEASQNKLMIERELDNPESELREVLQKVLDDGLYYYRKARCKFYPAAELFLELSETFITNKPKSKIIDELCSFDCICIDDLGAEKLTDTTRQNLYLIVDRMYREMKSLIITTNMTIDEINTYEPRIASRLAEMGKIYFIDGNDHRIL